MTNIDALLQGDEPVEHQVPIKNFGIDELHISRFAYDKAFRYAALVLQFSRNKNVEIGGFLTKAKDARDRVATDAFLPREQEVYRGEYVLSAEHVIKAGKELDQQGRKIVGWWHSHGRYETFHSKIDVNNQMVLLNEISPSNYIISPKEKVYRGLQSRVEGNNLIFWDPENQSITYRIGLKTENPELIAQELQILEEKRVGFAYSFVVNHHRWLSKRVPYCEVATRDLCLNCANVEDVSERVNYKIFDGEEYKLDNDQLKAEIHEKVIVERPRKLIDYFLPSVFEEKKTTGTLTKPDFGFSPNQEDDKY